MIGGPLWRAYLDVLRSGTPATMDEFRYAESRPGVTAESRFEVSVQRVRDPADGPLPRTDQAAVLLPEDRGIAETAWQTLDVGAASDVTVRFRLGGGVKHLRILSDLARDADGRPVKIYAVVQDVTARVDSRSEIDRLSDQVRVRELSALAEHRVARQLQQMIQPVPAGPFPLAELEAMVAYLPAGSTVLMGGDWYHADCLPDGRVVLRRVAEVRDHLGAVSADPGTDPLPRLHRLLHAPNPDDDTCTLAVHVRG